MNNKTEFFLLIFWFLRQVQQFYGKTSVFLKAPAPRVLWLQKNLTSHLKEK